MKAKNQIDDTERIEQFIQKMMKKGFQRKQVERLLQAAIPYEEDNELEEKVEQIRLRGNIWRNFQW